MDQSVAAVVVTYNRKQLLTECIDALLSQTRPVQRIYIVDNASTDGTEELLSSSGRLSHPTVRYTRLSRNTGGAGGFKHGMALAMADGHDWLWVMDDDAEPARDCLEKLLATTVATESSPPPMTPLKHAPDGRTLLDYLGFVDWDYRPLECVRPIPASELGNGRRMIDIEMATFVGLLLPRWLVERIGLPKEEFFIHADDLEYCLRMQGITKIRLVLDSLMLHKEEIKSALNEVALFGRSSLRIRFDRYWIAYYAPRNYVWLARRYCDRQALILARAGLFMLRKIAGILVHDDHKSRRIRFVVSQYVDGLTGVFDNEKPRRILYGERTR